MRVVADHVRSALMLIGDGVVPGNEGRGYVLRRLFRRSRARDALAWRRRPRDARSCSPTQPRRDERLVPGACTRTSTTSAPIAYTEEDAFRRTLAQRHHDLRHRRRDGQGRRAPTRCSAAPTPSRLHDTYGFPIDLTLEMAAEQGLTVDEEAFRSLMQEQKDRARADAKAKKGGHARHRGLPGGRKRHGRHGVPRLRRAAGRLSKVARDHQGRRVRARSHRQARRSRSCSAETPFYAEVRWPGRRHRRDQGRARHPRGARRAEARQGPHRAHRARWTRARSPSGDEVSAEVDAVNRRDASRGALRHAPHSRRAPPGARQARQPGGLVQQARLHAARLLVDARACSAGARERDRGHRQPRDPRGPARADTTIMYARRGQGAGRHGAVRREVRRSRARGGDRRPVLARTVRGNARWHTPVRSACSP